MHSKFQNIAIFLFLFAVLFVTSPTASADKGGDFLADSLLSLAPSEPTLQELLDSLGYNINVATDEVGWEVFCAVPGTTISLILEEVAGSSLSANSGWYNAADTADKTQLFSPANIAGDTATFVISDADSIGFYMTPNLTSYDSWYTQTGYNIDGYDHAKIFSTGESHEYVIAFEDLKDGGDGDFNDLLIKVHFENVAPTLTLPDDLYFNVCYENYVCFDVLASDMNCLSDILTLEMLEGYGDFTTMTDAGEISAEICFLPWAADSTYRFVFKVTDNSGASVTDTINVVYDINGRPTMSLPEDFDTLLCEYDSICVPVTLFDPDGDELEIEFLEGEGSYDPISQTFCFLPAQVDYASYTFVLKAYDECCQETETIYPALMPKPCPSDTITIGVTVNLLPELIAVPDFDTVICEPTEICFPVSVSDLNEGDNVTLTVSPNASYNETTGEVCVMADAEGTITVILTATDELCGATVEDTVNINVDFNDAPNLVLPNDTSYYFCSDPEEICFDVTVDDPDTFDNHTLELLEGPGVLENGMVCFTPSTSGEYTFIVKVTDICQVEDRDTITIAVDLNHPPVVSLPEDMVYQQCEPEEICFNAAWDDPDLPNDELTLIKVSGFGTLNTETGQWCFTPFGEGEYQFIIRVRDLCGEIDQDTLVINIEGDNPPTLTAPPTSSVYFCELGGEACITLTASDPDADENLVIEQIGGFAGSIDQETGEFCFVPDAAGDFNFMFRVVDKCGLADTAEATISIELNTPPEVTLPEDYSEVACVVDETICFDVVISDLEGDVTVDVLPIGTYNNGQVCFEAGAQQDTTFCLTVRATDECDAYTEDQICITVHFNLPPQITLASDTAMTVCELPDQFCVEFNASDPDGPAPAISVISGSAVVNGNQLCLINIDTVGIYCVELRATDQCGAYTSDDVCIVFEANTPPVLTMHANIDTAMCEVEQICFDNTAADADLPDDELTFTLADSPAGTTLLENGRICFTPPGEGTFSFTLRVEDQCGDYDEKTMTVTVDLNESPTIVAEEDSLYLEYCGSGAAETEVCFGGLVIGDPDGEVDDLTVEMIEGLGSFDPATLTTCFYPPVETATHVFVYKVTDTCMAAALDTILFHVFVNEDCDTGTCLEVWIEDSPCVPTNSYVELRIKAKVDIAIGGFDMVVKFDPTAFTLIDVYRGISTQDWEYFTFRTGQIGGCIVCPDGLVRILGIADQNDGMPHPPEDAYYPDSSIAIMKFLVTNDLNYSGMVYPVNFYWMDCGDNSFSSKTGDTLFVEKLILNQYGTVWDEFDEVNFPESGRFENIGIPDSCIEGDKTKPHRCVVMHNGSICIIHPDLIDARGDLNLNEIPYEIADAVLYTNYFIYGPAVFIINFDGQKAASDVNADGRTLTVGDLVYLVRVLIGDAEPVDKLMPFDQNVQLRIENEGDGFAVKSSSDADIGCAYMLFDVSNVNGIPQIVKSDDIEAMQLKYSVSEGLMRVLIYDFSTDRIEAGDNILGTIIADGEITLIATDFADYNGSDLNVYIAEKTVLPNAFELSQNYPNPFNPETEISLSLPEASQWQIDIYNINGRLVETYSGYNDAGVVTVKFQAENLASGMYFYRATAGSFTDTKKMILLK